MSGKVKVILSIVITAILVSGIWGFITYQKTKTITAKFEGEISQLTATLDALGPDVECYTITEDFANHYSNNTAGQIIGETAIQPITVPSSLVGEAYITNMSQIVGKYCKVNIVPGTPITSDLLMAELYDDTLRDVDISVNSWVVGMRVGDYVDLNITFPYGEDYIVLPRKRVQYIGDKTIKMYLTEEEWHTYQSALVDYYLHASEGARLYLKKYVEPGVQPTAIAYYAASDAVRTIMKADPNVVSRAAVAAQDSMRPAIDGILNQFITEQTTIQSQAGLIAGGRSQFNGDVQSDYRNNEQNRADTETEDTYEEEDVLVNFDESKPEETTAAPRETEAPTPVETEAETTAPETTAEETMAPTETTGVAETENLEEPVG